MQNFYEATAEKLEMNTEVHLPQLYYSVTADLKYSLYSTFVSILKRPYCITCRSMRS